MTPPSPAPEGRSSCPDVDAALLASGAGDQDAFARFYDATSARVFGLVLRVLRDAAQAEEVTQEVYLDVWRSAPSFDPARGSSVSWILTLAHRRAVDRVRSAQAQSARDDAYESRHEPDIPDPTAEAAIGDMQAGRVRAALEELSELQRRAVELAFLEGLTHREVAARLDIPVGTAKTRIRDGMLRLRRVLGTDRGGGAP